MSGRKIQNFMLVKLTKIHLKQSKFITFGNFMFKAISQYISKIGKHRTSSPKSEISYFSKYCMLQPYWDILCSSTNSMLH